MKLISHRGNINGKIESLENSPDYIDKAILKGYDVEIDVWYNNIFWLGHDNPQYKIEIDWLLNRQSKLWIHCKNYEAIIFLNDYNHNLNYFWHDIDNITLTSKKYIWAYPGKQPIKNSIAVLPEIYNDDITQCIGICSDYIEKYKTK